MKNLILLIFLFWEVFINIWSIEAQIIEAQTIETQTTANTLIPRIDTRVEFLSIAYHLAKSGFVPDSDKPNFGNKVYTAAMNNHFTPYRQHPFLRHLQTVIDSLEKLNGDISSWEIPSLAIHLTKPPRCKPLVPFTIAAEEFDAWDNRTLLTPKMIALLNDFYDSSHAEAFFAAQKPYYKRIEQYYRTTYTALHPRWVQDFFRTQPTEQYYPILALGTREGAYLRVNFDKSRRNTYTIYNTTTFDKNGFPTRLNDTMITQLMLHEVIHCFANHAIDMDSVALKPFAETILSNPAVFGTMKNTFYGNWKYLLYESIVRAITIRYNMSNKEYSGVAGATLAQQEKAGFFWMRDLVNLLGEYEHNRKKYPTFPTFLPKVRIFFAKIADEARNKPERK